MEVLNLKERYPFTCPCGAEWNIVPGIFMRGFQINTCRVNCPTCKRCSSAKIDDENTRIVHISFDIRDANEPVPLPTACYREVPPTEEHLYTAADIRRFNGL